MHEKGIDLLKAMEVFVAVADTGSMTVAAESLHITQSAVSQYVKQLERELNQGLIDRTVRPIRLTTAGAMLHALGVKLIVDVGEIRSAMRRAASQEISQLRIAAIGSLLGTLVPDLVTAIEEQIKVHRIVVWRGFATTSDLLLKKREIDLLITSDPMLDMDGLERFELFSEPFILVLPAAMAFRSPSLAELGRSKPFIRYSKRSRTGWLIETHLRRLRLDIADSFEFDSNEDVIAMVAAGRGWAISTPSQVLHGMRSADRFRITPLPRPGFRRTTTLVVRTGELGKLSRQIADLTCEVIRTKYLARLRPLAPWIEEQILIGEPQAA